MKQNHIKVRAITIIAITIVVVGVPLLIYTLMHAGGTAAAWYGDSWGFRTKLTINHTKVGADQTDFPVYVDFSLMPGGFFSHVNQTDARDIRVTKSDGTTELPREVVFYNSTTHTGELHFKYTGTLSSSTDTSVYIYYGNPAATDYAANATYGKNNVWDSSFSGVLHVHNSSFADSTSGAHNATNNGSTSVTGKFGDGRQTAADGQYFYVPMSGYIHASVDTIEWWYKSTSTPLSFSSFFNSSEGNNQLAFYRNSSDTTLSLALNNANFIDWTSLSTNVFDGGWHHIAVVLDTVGNTEELFIDGTSRGQKTQNPANTDISTYNFLWGGNTASAPANGVIDEARVSSNILRSSTWISTEYNNQNSPSTFFTSSGRVEEQKTSAVLNFAFDEGYGTTAHDSSPNGYTGTLSGSPTPSWQPEDLCISGKCLYYNGSTAYTSVTTSVPNVQSVSFWVKPKTNGETLVDFDGGTHYISASSGTITATGFSGTTIVYVNGQSGGLLVANVWQHVEVTTTVAFDATNITIGKKTAFLNGFIDEFRVYDYARTADQVKLDFNSRTSKAGTAVRFGPDLGNTLSNGLVSYWKMDENTGTSTTDSSGNGNNSTTWTGATWATGKYGSATSYNGSDQVVRFAESSSTDLGATTDSYTVNAWVKFTTCANVCDIVDKMSNSSAAYPFHVYIDTSFKISFSVRDSSSNVPSSLYNVALNDGGWHFLSAVRDVTNHKLYLYVDGAKTLSGQTATDTTTASAANNDDISIGNGGGSYTNNDFNGQIDDVRIYNRALSPAEVGQLYNWAPGPVGWWKMDENTGTNAYDSSGNGNNSTTWTGATWTTGKYGSATSYNGSNQVVQFAETPSTDLGLTTNSYTVSAWIKTSASCGGTCDIVSKMTGIATAHPIHLFLNSSNQPNFDIHDGTNGPTIGKGVTLNDGNWHFIAGVRDVVSDKIYIYSDIVNTNSTTDTTTVTAANNDDISFGNGGNSYTTNDFNGQIDNVRIYNYVRTPIQMTEDMNGGHPAPGSPVGSAVGWWKFDEGNSDTLNSSGSCGSTCNLSRAGSTKPSWTNAGKYSKALSFGGSNAYALTSGDPAAFKITNDLTLSAWIYLNNNSSSHDVIAKDGASGSYAYDLNINSLGKLIMEISKDGTSVTGGTNGATAIGNSVLSTGTWYHVVGVYIPSVSMTVYVNGIQDGINTSVTSSIKDITTNLEIGGENTTSNLMNGTIDDVRVFNSALTSDQVKVLYNQSSEASFGALSTDSSGNASYASQREFCPPGNTEGNCGGSNDPSPVGYWKMDEGSWTNDCSTATVMDSSGNGNSGKSCPASTGPTGKAIGKFGNAGSFDGTNDYISLPAIALNGNKGTISAWVYMPTVPANGVYYSVLMRNYQDEGMDILNDGGTVVARFRVGGNGTCSSSYNTSLAPNTWYHLVGTYDGQNRRVYVNGQLSNTCATTGNWLDDSSTWGISSMHGTDPSNYFKGIIDDVKLYNYARTPAQIAWDYNRGAPVGWWKIDECTGTAIHDSSGNGSDATLTINAGSRVTSAGTCGSGTGTEAWNNGTTGKYNASLDFDYSGPDYAKESVADYRINDTMGTATAWVKVNALEANDMYVFVSSDEASSTRGFGFGIKNNGKPFIEWQNGGSDNNVTGNSAISTGQFHFITWWSDGTQYKIYVDGALQATTLGGSGINNGAWFSTVSARDNFTIGVVNYSSIGYGFNGLIDDVRLYNYPLSQQQILTVMNQGTAHFGQ